MSNETKSEWEAHLRRVTSQNLLSQGNLEKACDLINEAREFDYSSGYEKGYAAGQKSKEKECAVNFDGALRCQIAKLESENAVLKKELEGLKNKLQNIDDVLGYGRGLVPADSSKLPLVEVEGDEIYMGRFNWNKEPHVVAALEKHHAIKLVLKKG